MLTPYLSVIITTHNRSLLLERAILSVNCQDYHNLVEIIVVSDLADRNTDEVCFKLLKEKDIYIRRNGNKGPSASRNIGLKIASGRNIMFLDDDDSWSFQFLKNLLCSPRSNNYESFYFNCNIIKESRPESGPVKLSESFLNTADRLTPDVFVKNQVHMSCFIFSKSLLNGLEFDTTMRAYEDWDFLLSAFERQFPIHIPITCSNIYEVDDNTTDRRGSSKDATNFNAPIDYLYVYRRHASPTEEIRAKRKKLLDSVNLPLAIELL
jgi:GalNAc5-diNAcBac-PP-undecaprenol beta-1,3-glucosyltransferase